MTDAEARKVRDALVRSFFWEWIRLAERRQQEKEPPKEANTHERDKESG